MSKKKIDYTDYLNWSIKQTMAYGNKIASDAELSAIEFLKELGYTVIKTL